MSRMVSQLLPSFHCTTWKDRGLSGLCGSVTVAKAER